MEFSYFCRVEDLKKGDILWEIFKKVFDSFQQENADSKFFRINNLDKDKDGKKLLGVSTSTETEIYIGEGFEKSIEMTVLHKIEPLYRCYVITVGPFKQNVYSNLFNICVSDGVTFDLKKSEIPEQILKIRNSILLDFFRRIRSK